MSSWKEKIDNISNEDLQKIALLLYEIRQELSLIRKHLSKEIKFPIKREPQTDEGSKAYSVEEIRRHHPRAYEKWTPEEDELLAREYGEGVSISELAMKHQRKIGAIRSRLNKLGLISE